MAKYRHFIFLLPADHPKLSRLIIFLFGSAMPLGFAPFGWALLAPLLLLPLLLVCLTVSPRDAAAHAFWFGLGMFLTGTYWIYISVHVFGRADLWIALFLMVGLSLVMAALISISGWLVSRLSHGEPLLILPIAPAAWVVVEWFRGWILTGFPWLALGYAQIDSPLAGWAPVLGIYGVSFMLMLSLSAILMALMTAGGLRIVGLLTAVLPWVTGGILSTVNWTDPAGQAMRVSIVQAGVSQDKKWDRSQLQPIMEFYRSRTLAVPESALVVWPEVAIPALDDRIDRFLNLVESEAYQNGQSIIFGILERSFERSDEGDIYNSVFLYGGDQRQAYRKRHLVPFGEYFPVPDNVRQWMKMQNLPHSDLAAGEEVQPLLVAANGARLAIAICYEDAYGAEQVYAFPEATLLINVSNDAWFGDSIAPHQHLEIARMRALEVGRFAVRSTNTGISAFIGPRGELLQTGTQFAAELMTADVEPRTGLTPYAAAGNWPVIGLGLAILGFFWIRSRASL